MFHDNIAWRLYPNNRKQLMCNYCTKTTLSEIFQMKNHLVRTHTNVAHCSQVLKYIKNLFLDKLHKNSDLFQEADVTSGSESNIVKKWSLDSYVQRGFTLGQSKIKQTNMNKTMNDREAVNKEVWRKIYAEELSFNIVKSRYFKNVMEAIASFGKGYAPLFHESRVTCRRRMRAWTRCPWRDT